MSKGDELKRNVDLKLYFVSSRNVCDPRPLDVPFACKHASFAHESKASSSKSKISDLECSPPPLLSKHHHKVDMSMRFALTLKPTLRRLWTQTICVSALATTSIIINIAMYFNIAFIVYSQFVKVSSYFHQYMLNKYVFSSPICNNLCLPKANQSIFKILPKKRMVWSSDREHFWAQSVEILMLVSPTGHMLTSSGFPSLNWGICYKIPLKWSVIFVQSWLQPVISQTQPVHL